MAFDDGGHSLERIFLSLTDSCPLPVGWACLRQPEDERNVLFAHVVVDDQLKVQCDRTILLSPMMTEKSSCLVQVTFTESSSSSSPSNSTSLLIRDLTDVSNLLRVSYKGDESSPLKKVAKKSTGSPSRPSGLKREMEGAAQLEQVDSPPTKRSKSPSPVATCATISCVLPYRTPLGNQGITRRKLLPRPPTSSSRSGSSDVAGAVSLEPVTMAVTPAVTPPVKTNPFKKAVDKERPYKCPECDKTFTRGNHLKDHMRLHAGETYECPVCQYQCILQTKFTHHLTQHNNRGPFPCSQCGKSFERAHDLARHLPVDHQIDTGFRLSHFKNSFSPAQFKDQSSQPPNLLSIAGRPPLSSSSSTAAFSRSLQSSMPTRPSLPPSFPSISAAPVTITDFGDGSFEDMQRLMKLYGENGGGDRVDDADVPSYDGDDGDDSVIPLDDEEEWPRVKSLDDEFGDDAILVE